MESLLGAGCVITGGASGIGLALAHELGRRGGRVVIADIDQNALDQAVRALRGAAIDAAGTMCDVRTLEAVEALADFAFDRLGHVDVVVNNAGVVVHGPAARTSHEQWRWVLDVNLWGPIHGVEAFVPRMIEQGRPGHLLFTASYGGLVPVAGMGPYCISKSGVVALAEVLRSELRSEQIGVSVLCPMMVETNLTRSGRSDAPTTKQANAQLAKAVPAVANPSRILSPREVAVRAVDAIEADDLYVLTHSESRGFIRKRFDRIDRTFE